MRYLKDFTTFLFEKKNNELPWNNLFKSYFNRITGNNKEAKIEKLQKFLSKDIFNSVLSKSIILTDDDKKVYSQSNTIAKFGILMKQEYIYQLHDRYQVDLGNITDYLSDNNTTLADLDVRDFEQLITKADEYHDSLDVIDDSDIRTDETDKTDVFITYPDGWYWINLNVDYSEDEAKHMGHCGRDTGKILFSLRDDKKQSHITASYSPSFKALYQIKGVKNSKPKAKYHQKIVDMILNDKHPVNMIKTGSYKPELDFSLLDLPFDEMKEIFKQKPALEMTDKMFADYVIKDDLPSLLSMCVNGFKYDGYTKYSDDDLHDIITFINDSNIKNNEIINTFLSSVLNTKAADLINWTNDAIVLLKNSGYKLNLTEEVLFYPGVKKLINHFGEFEINNATIEYYITYDYMEGFEYVSSLGYGIKMSDEILYALITANSTNYKYYMSNIDTTDYKISISQFTRDMRYYTFDESMKSKLEDIFTKITFKNDDNKDLAYAIGDLNNCRSEMQNMLIDAIFDKCILSDDLITEIIYTFDNMDLSTDYSTSILRKIITNGFGIEKILKIIFDTKIEDKYIFNVMLISGRYYETEEAYEILSKVFNENEDNKYCLSVLDTYISYIMQGENMLNITPDKKQDILDYVSKAESYDISPYMETISFLRKI